MRNSTMMTRRNFVTALGIGVGLAATRGHAWLRDARLPTEFGEVLSALDASLSAPQRALAILPTDDPIRQITNTVNVFRSAHIGTIYNEYQIALIRQLYRSMLSVQGQDWFHETTSLEGKFEGSALKIYADDPTRALTPDNAQVVLNGGHYMLRSSGLVDTSKGAYVFGGPIAYGQQLGNGRYKVEGNAFKAHGDAMHEFHQSLSDTDRAQAYVTAPPLELVTQTQGEIGHFPGVRIGSTSAAAQERAKAMLDTVFAAYPSSQQRDAMDAIEQHGGLASLYIALFVDYGFYADGERYTELNKTERRARELPYVQVWRIEGPNCVIHFKGYPHVHAYINVVRDPAKIAVGEALTEAQFGLNTQQVRRFMQDAIQRATRAQFAYYPDWVLGRLSPGIVSTGSLLALDPYRNRIVFARVPVATMSDSLKHSLREQGAVLEPNSSVRIATIDYMLARADLVGDIAHVDETQITVFDAMVSFVRDINLDARYA